MLKLKRKKPKHLTSSEYAIYLEVMRALGDEAITQSAFRQHQRELNRDILQLRQELKKVSDLLIEDLDYRKRDKDETHG